MISAKTDAPTTAQESSLWHQKIRLRHRQQQHSKEIDNSTCCRMLYLTNINIHIDIKNTCVPHHSVRQHTKNADRTSCWHFLLLKTIDTDLWFVLFSLEAVDPQVDSTVARDLDFKLGIATQRELKSLGHASDSSCKHLIAVWREIHARKLQTFW